LGSFTKRWPLGGPYILGSHPFYFLGGINPFGLLRRVSPSFGNIFFPLATNWGFLGNLQILVYTVGAYMCAYFHFRHPKRTEEKPKTPRGTCFPPLSSPSHNRRFVLRIWAVGCPPFKGEQPGVGYNTGGSPPPHHTLWQNPLPEDPTIPPLGHTYRRRLALLLTRDAHSFKGGVTHTNA